MMFKYRHKAKLGHIAVRVKTYLSLKEQKRPCQGHSQRLEAKKEATVLV